MVLLATKKRFAFLSKTVLTRARFATNSERCFECCFWGVILKIAVFGGTGRTGELVVSNCLALGHSVHVLSRAPNPVLAAHAGLTVEQGNVLDFPDVDKIVKGKDAVISCLEATRNSPPDVCSRGMRNIAAAMEKNGVQRLIAGSSFGVFETNRGMYSKIVWFFFPRQMMDKQKMESIVFESGRNWTVFRSVILSDGPRSSTYEVTEKPVVGWFSTVSRANVADCLVEALADSAFCKRSPSVYDSAYWAKDGTRKEFPWNLLDFLLNR